MKSSHGVTLVELIIGMALGAILISLLVRAYTSLYSTYLYATRQLTLLQELRLSLQLIERDLQQAGIFGSFSFHFRGFDYSTSVEQNAVCATSEWCAFDQETVGIRSDVSSAHTFSDFAASVASEGLVLRSGSEILRLQYGSGPTALLDPLDYQPNCLADNTCTVSYCSILKHYYYNYLYFIDQGIDRERTLFFAASSNHGYLLSFATAPLFIEVQEPKRLVLRLITNPDAPGCPVLDSPAITVESVLKVISPSYPSPHYLAYKPAMSNFQLSNFVTRYYFVASAKKEQGLYVKTLGANGALSQAMLVAPYVTSLTMSYRLTRDSQRYTQCTTEAMQASINPNCSGNWAQITAVSIMESAEIVEPQRNLPLLPLTISSSISVGW